MSYQTIPVGEVAARIMRLKGLNPTLNMPLMDDKQQGQYTDAINTTLNDIWSDKFWKDIMRFEPRTFRPAWDTTATYTVGNQVYRQNPAWTCDTPTEEKDGYFQAVTANNSIDPWTDAGTNWTRIDKKNDALARYIEFYQPWEKVKIDDVEYPRCACQDDPRYKAWDALQWLDGTVPMFDTPGILFTGCNRINKPWLRFRPVPPKFVLYPWVGTTNYSAGALVYDDPNTYIALIPNVATQPSNSNGTWAAVGFPEMFANYVAFAGAAMTTNETLGAYRNNEAVQEELERLRLRYIDRPGVQTKAMWQTGGGRRGKW